MISSSKAMPMMPPSAAVASDHWFTGILNSLKTATQIET